MKKNKKALKEVWFYARVILLVLVLLFPFVIMLSISMKETAETIGYPPTIIPRTWTMEHFVDIFNARIFPFIKYIKNSLYIAMTTSVVAVLLGILGGYALSRLKFRGKSAVSEMFFLVYMFSGILLIVPLFKMLSAVGFSNSREAVIICMIVQTLPTAIYMTRSYFDTIPKELEEAGKVDGLSKMGIIFRIVVPLSMSGIISVFVYAFMIAWNDVLFASIFIDSPDLMTIPIGLNSLFNTPDYIWGRMMAASLVTSLPIVIMYGFSQHLIKSGSTDGGVKG
ncbi:MAG: carbohydrate ABC transporter permease [Dorea sp.]|nr:carbohydrate ABC transporter permease [Dorea sp.]